MPLRAIDVFTPNDFPEHTYVEPGGADLESRLRLALNTPNAVVSVSGPSKSGKTVLIKRVVTNDNLIVVSGAEISDPDDLWNRILDWMGSPNSTNSQSRKEALNKIQKRRRSAAASPELYLEKAKSGLTPRQAAQLRRQRVLVEVG